MFPSLPKVDALIATAISLEYNEARQVSAGAANGSEWEELSGPSGLPISFRTFIQKNNQPLRIALALAGDMGDVAAANLILPLLDLLTPRCIAMTGVCAGRPGSTRLGDVIAAERLFFHDSGKQLPEANQQDLRTYNLRDDWKRKIENSNPTTIFHDAQWFRERPIPLDWQEDWVLTNLVTGNKDPSHLPECSTHCPQWTEVIDSLWRSGDIEDGTLKPTENGTKRATKFLIKYKNKYPNLSPSEDLLPFKIHVAPMGSGDKVVEDQNYWGFISGHMRKTLGLEMEATTIGAIAHAQRHRHLETLVMKGVMDFANHGRDDQFKKFAARASAECLIAFLRDNLETEVTPDLDDILSSGRGNLSTPVLAPSKLLNARYEIVPFHLAGRNDLIQELDNWCSTGPPIDARLIHADGGLGKTRLAIELVRRLDSIQWVAGFLNKNPPSDWLARLCALGRPIFVVLDYAESRADLSSILARLLRYAEQTTTRALRKIRILLLARNAADWWNSLIASDSGIGDWLARHPPRELLPLGPSNARKEEIFRTAVFEFSKKLNKPVTQPLATLSLSDEKFDRVLYIHMAALATVEGLPFDSRTLMDVILDHEERFWQTAPLNDIERATQRRTARRIVAASTLRGGFPERETALNIASRATNTSPQQLDEILTLLHRIYQTNSGLPGTFIPPLAPDLLGESMVIRLASPSLAEDRVPANWIASVFPANEAPQTLRTGFEVLGRASTRNPKALKPWLVHMLEKHQIERNATIALTAAKTLGQHSDISPLGNILSEMLESFGTLKIAHDLDRTGIPPQSNSLTLLSEWVARTLAQEQKSNPIDRITSFMHWGETLQSLGRHQEALTATRQAETELSKPQKFSYDTNAALLARCARNLGIHLDKLGHPEEALNYTRHAYALCSYLATKDNRYAVNLAAALNNLAIRLRSIGHYEEALSMARKAVDAYRRLPQDKPETRSELANALNLIAYLGTFWNDAVRLQEAHQAALEAVSILRILSEFKRDQTSAVLGLALINLSNTLRGIDRPSEALSVCDEAVAHYRSLDQHMPGVHLIELANAIHNRALLLSFLESHALALIDHAEVIEIRRGLVKKDPRLYSHILARSLANLSIHHSDMLNDFEKALPFATEAFEILWRCFQRQPQAHSHALNKIVIQIRDVYAGLKRPIEDSIQVRISQFESAGFR
ncbi:MAG: tetratricopeptide repeat protein [Myxococcaceae bacterium]|nr:MAG: tetratricopeptide repeat protein [Myxococcaceae bacterium]